MLWAASLAVLTLILGMIVGWYARDVREKIRALYALWRERIETPPGVVKPIVTRGSSRAQLADDVADDDEGGGVLRPKPLQVEAMRELGERSILAGNAGRRKKLKGL